MRKRGLLIALAVLLSLSSSANGQLKETAECKAGFQDGAGLSAKRMRGRAGPATA